MKILNKLYTAALALLLFNSCQSGLEYDDVPESIYSDVNLAGGLCNVKSRELFQNQIYAVNWNRWVENYIATVTIGNYKTAKEWTNTTAEAVTVNGVSVAPGAKVKLANTLSTEDNASAPGGKLYIVNLYADAKATYKTANKGYMFDATRFSGDFKLLPPVTNGRSEQVVLPVKKNEVIVEILLSQEYNCKVYPQDNAPEMGKPGDFTQPRRYLVVNESRLPAGVERAQRLYEVRITFLP